MLIASRREGICVVPTDRLRRESPLGTHLPSKWGIDGFPDGARILNVVEGDVKQILGVFLHFCFFIFSFRARRNCLCRCA